jgi:hypothetical protein
MSRPERVDHRGAWTFTEAPITDGTVVGEGVYSVRKGEEHGSCDKGEHYGRPEQRER